MMTALTLSSGPVQAAGIIAAVLVAVALIVWLDRVTRHCQRCHLTIQTRVLPETPYFLEHSAWIRPYVSGFYAKKYEREEAIARMDELLAYERIT